jgi:hypothetical protein
MCGTIQDVCPGDHTWVIFPTVATGLIAARKTANIAMLEWTRAIQSQVNGLPRGLLGSYICSDSRTKRVAPFASMA